MKFCKKLQKKKKKRREEAVKHGRGRVAAWELCAVALAGCWPRLPFRGRSAAGRGAGQGGALPSAGAALPGGPGQPRAALSRGCPALGADSTAPAGPGSPEQPGKRFRKTCRRAGMLRGVLAFSSRITAAIRCFGLGKMIMTTPSLFSDYNNNN